jgi:L-lactate dehydrogenase (cytochrome)
MPMLDRVEAAGYDTLVVTVDVPVNGSREENVRDGFSTPLRPSIKLAWQGISHPRWLIGTAARTLINHGLPHFENGTAERGAPVISRHAQRSFSGRETLSWHHLETIRKRWTGTLVLKGIIAPEDARRACELGADGIIVSNHGGRQLDSAPSSIAMLPEIKQVTGDMSVMLDSGVRRGSDVLKAMALGADFVFVGRPMLFAAAVAGEAGVRHAIDILSAEIDRDMAMLGLADLRDMSRVTVRGNPPRG